MQPNRLKTIAFKAPLAVLGVAFLLTLGGCPGGADLENPDLYKPVGSGAGPSTGGTGGTGGSIGDVMLTVPDCPDYGTVLSTNCAMVGCHVGKSAQSGLDLSPNDGLASRLWNVPAEHGDIYCPDIMDYCETVPAACPAGAKLVDSSNWENSWMIAKLRANQTGCGDAMPPTVFTPDNEKCLESMIQVIASLQPSN